MGPPFERNFHMRGFSRRLLTFEPQVLSERHKMTDAVAVNTSLMMIHVKPFTIIQYLSSRNVSRADVVGSSKVWSNR